MFFDLPKDPTAKRGRKKPTPAPKKAPRRKASAPPRRRKAAKSLVPSERPRRIAVPAPVFEQFLRAGDWPGGGDKKTFTYQGSTYWPWLVLENKVAARVVKRGKQGAVVEFVRKGSPLDRE